MFYFDFHHHKKNTSAGIYNLKLLEEIPSSIFSVGIHPREVAENFPENFQWLQQVSTHRNCVAIGECGLDGRYPIPDEVQMKSFLKQMLWAKEIEKPLLVHCVRRFSELVSLKKKFDLPIVVHGFNKKETVANELLQHGISLSFGKAVLQNISLQNILKNIPSNCFFLETDDDEFEIEELYRLVSEIRNISLSELKILMEENFERLRYLK